jgi:pimeloyl-ACP methyl ester carboxylesterase
MSDRPDSVAFKRRAFARDDGKGNSVAEWTLTSPDITDPVQIVAQPICTVPVIFVPGIMGSNLMTTVSVAGKEAGEDVWLMNGKGGAASAWYKREAATRQARLNPATTAVFAGGDVPSNIPTIGSAKDIRERRFWGEVSAMSYQSFLVWLEKTLNERKRVETWRAELGTPDYARQLEAGMQFKPLSEKDVGHAANFRFPVYACGYNWLASNRKAAETLARRIRAVIAANNSASYSCQKVILITHSMGGLVARACSELAGMREHIAGIVHGVMPATGAAVAYKRVRGGTEGSAGAVIGPDAATVTAVFANSPGALQLLPSKLYGSGWLQLGTGIGPQFKAVATLPKADPYEEIYKQRGQWWSLVREELINPAQLDGHKGWSDYIQNITEAARFHNDLGTKYHPNTFSFHGNGREPDNGLTWGTVRWQARTANDLRTVTRNTTGHAAAPMTATPAQMLTLRPACDDGEGKASATLDGNLRYDFELSGKDSVGDGTVPEVSGQAPAKAGVWKTYHLNLDAEGHEGAYRVGMAQRVTMHSILSILRTVQVSQ